MRRARVSPERAERRPAIRPRAIHPDPVGEDAERFEAVPGRSSLAPKASSRHSIRTTPAPLGGFSAGALLRALEFDY